MMPASTLPPMLAHLGPHTGDSASAFFDGLLHPLSGLDHLLALCAIGLFAARLATARASATRGSPLIAPALTALGLLVGFALGRLGHLAAASDTTGPAPLVEVALAGTVLALGLVLASRLAARAWVLAIPLVTLFHGQAHGLEAPPDAAVFALGMTLTSVALVILVRALALAWHPHQRWLSATGGAIAATGLALVLTRL